MELKFPFHLKILLSCVLLLCSLNSMAQENADEEKKSPRKGAINFEFSIGMNNTTPLGIQPKALRDRLEAGLGQPANYSGKLLPKTAAYVGILFDYQFHEIAAFGTGLIYTPKGFWMFESNVIEGFNWNSRFYEQRKTFVTVDYFDIPVFFKFYTQNKHISLRFGPVISMALLSKVRVEYKGAGENEKLKYRLGEGGEPDIYYSEIPNSIPKFIVPGFEAAINVGNMSGLQGTCVVGFSGSIYENSDWKSFIARLGLSYSISK